jgi:serine/threonine protein kinase/formylglycine-generating enzyme required for sulfatase activity
MTPASVENSMEEAIKELRRFPRAQWLDLARSDQSLRWRKRVGLPAEAYLEQLPEVRGDREETLVLISGEIKLRRELGESPALEEYQQRFPEFADDIALQFSLHRILVEASDDHAIATDAGSGDVELPGYAFLNEIARGASGVVYQARQESLGRFVAIKVIPIAGADATRLARHRQEAEILAQLNHPHVVHIHEVREYRGCFHLVMEYVCGTTLAAHNAGRPLTPENAVHLAITLAETVHAVHEAGVLHRDLKPSNVLVTLAGELKISDFGMAKLQSRSLLLTAESSVLGTPSYMAPEQAVGEAHSIGPSADVYSLGAILYELLTGRPPFLGVTVLDTLSQIRTREPVAPRQLQPRTPRDLETICLKCLAKVPRQRYATGAALAEDLRRFRDGMPILARPPGAVERLARLVKRKPVVSALLAGVVALSVVLIAALAMTSRQRRQMAAAALVDSIATADSQALPQLLGKIPSQQRFALPLVRAELSESKAGEPRWVNLTIAELTADHSASGEDLLKYLPTARPGEVPSIVEVLAPKASVVQETLWNMLLDDHTSDEARLRLACLAAQVSPGDAKWTSVAPMVSRALAHQQPLDIGTFSQQLRPARAALIPSLVALTRDPHLEPLARKAAISIVARFAADQPDVLVALIVEAEPDEAQMLLASLEEHVTTVLPQLQAVARKTVSIDALSQRSHVQTKHDIEATYDAGKRRAANATALMWRLGDPNPTLWALRRETDPALRAWLIELLAPLGVSADSLLENAEHTTDSGVRQALVLALGRTSFHNARYDELNGVITRIAKIYCNDPDAAVHAACGWLLNTRLNRAGIVREFTAAPVAISADRQWFIGRNSHTFTVIPKPVTFKMGSAPTEILREPDEDLRDVRIDHPFAIGTEEVTVAQFLAYSEHHFVHLQFSPTADCPMNNVSWFDAVSYCRWLSEQEGIPESQMCYPPLQEIKPGMRLPADCVQRSGYRLPTEVEWEFACRGGVSASRHFGEGEELLDQYAWFLRNSDDHAWPVGTLKPNDFGLFDMLGNVMERCHDTKSSATTVGDTSLIIDQNMLAAVRGGEFGAAPHNLRSARRHLLGVTDEWASVGFRVARTLPGK